MSYSSGITNVQQGFDAIGAAASASASRTSKATQSLSSVSELAQAGTSSTSAVDQTSLSQTSGLMAQALSGSDDVRTDKVAELQQSIAAGTYNVSSSAVADKLISSLQQ